MKDEASPITADELVIRLIWGEMFKAGTVSERAFAPKPEEHDGISVFRAACLANPRDVLTVMAPEKRGRYVLALLPGAEILALGLTVEPAKIETISGHAVLPELTIDFHTSDKARCRELQGKLAAIAARNVIPPTA